jgi:arylsulfatase
VRRGNTPDIIPGPDDTFASYGKSWANLSNTPFREYKHWVHEGGIATPLVVRWPDGGLEPGAITHNPHQLPDVMATVLDVTGAPYPARYEGVERLPLEGVSMRDTWLGGAAQQQPLFWEHEGNAACRRGRWKLVRKYPGDWELYDIDVDRAELHDVAASHPDIVTALAAEYSSWAQRCGVIPRELIEEHYARKRAGAR